jgi:hypothetical protein
MRDAQATLKGSRPGVETLGWSAGRRYDNSVVRERSPDAIGIVRFLGNAVGQRPDSAARSWPRRPRRGG